MGTVDERTVQRGTGTPQMHGSGTSEREVLEELVDFALDVPGGSELGRLLRADQRDEGVWRRLRLAERGAHSPAR